MSINIGADYELRTDIYDYNLLILENRELFFNLINKTVGYEDVSYNDPNLSGGNITGGINTFNISEISSKSKFSLDYYSCTGVICNGVSKSTGEKVFFMSHQDSLKVLYTHNKEFLEAIMYRLHEMLYMCHESTINIGLFGGTIHRSDAYPSNYSDVVIMIRKIVDDILEKDLNILVGPNRPDINGLEIDDISANFAYNAENELFLANKPKQITTISNKGFSSKNIKSYLSMFD